MFGFIKDIIAKYRLKAELDLVTLDDSKNKKMLDFILSDEKVYFRLTEAEKTYLDNILKTCSDEEFDFFKFDLGEHNGGELAYLIACFKGEKGRGLIEGDNAFQYLWDNFPCFSVRLNERQGFED